MDYFISDDSLKCISNFSNSFKNGLPFSHGIFDGFVDPLRLKQIESEFPKPEHIQWWKYDNALEKKLAQDNLALIPPIIRQLIHEMMEKRFVSMLEALTGIPHLIVDHNLSGGGLHQILPGGKLDIHADYNYHPFTKLDRRLNVLLYLNSNWDFSWGGDLEFWDEQMHFIHGSKIAPIFNRMVVFTTTDKAFHGHPEPLKCPEGITRKSIALYYYTNGRPLEEVSPPHATIFKRRPQDPFDSEVERLRIKRAIRKQGAWGVQE